MNGKTLATRPGSVGYLNGYGGALQEQQNGYTDSVPRLAVKPPPLKPNGVSLTSPNGAVALKGYENEIIDGFAGAKPRYNPVSESLRWAGVWLISGFHR